MPPSSSGGAGRRRAAGIGTERERCSPGVGDGTSYCGGGGDDEVDARERMRAPQVEPAAGLPSRVTIYEVGARDGLQNEKTVVPTATKVEFIERLVRAGLPLVETTSFVPPSWIPQLADASEVLAALGPDGLGRARPVLVPNERGLDRALEAGVGAIAIFGSATETFARRNLNRSVAESVEMFTPVVARAREAGCGCGPTSPCASATPGRATSPSTRSSTWPSG